MPGVTDVSGGVVLFANGLEVRVYGRFSRFLVVEGQRKGIAVELAALGLEQPFSRPRQTGERIAHHSADRIEGDAEDLHGVGVPARKELVQCH